MIQILQFIENFRENLIERNCTSHVSLLYAYDNGKPENFYKLNILSLELLQFYQFEIPKITNSYLSGKLNVLLDHSYFSFGNATLKETSHS